jgi:hypothetical protein
MADAQWKSFTYECIVAVAKQLFHFTTDDVDDYRRAARGPITQDARALGPLMLQAKHEGICRPTSRWQTVRHKRPLRVWESCIK